MSDHLLVFNIERIGPQALKAQKRHDRREGGDLSHTDPSLHASNIVMYGTGDPVKDVQGVMVGHSVKVRKDNESPYTRVVLSASPDLFKDPKRTRKWLDASMGFLRETWGDGLAYAVLHLDEKTPHLHAVVVPIVESNRGPISSHHTHPATKGRNSYQRLRKACASRLELGYGEPGNTPKTIEERAKIEAAALVQAATLSSSRMLDQVDREWAHINIARASLQRDREALQRDREALTLRASLLHSEALKLREAEAAERIRALTPTTPPEKAKPTEPTPTPFEFSDPPTPQAPRPRPRGRDRGEER
jgi:hypothetical protein